MQLKDASRGVAGGNPFATSTTYNTVSQINVGGQGNIKTGNDFIAQGAQINLKDGGAIRAGGNILLGAVKDKTVIALTTLLLMTALPGCMIAQDISELATNGKLTTPHEAFISHYSWYVGRDVLPKSVPVEQLEEIETRKFWGAGADGFRKLPNGNWELENDLYKGACRIFYEYNPVTRIVVSWRYEGGDENCVQNPYT